MHSVNRSEVIWKSSVIYWSEFCDGVRQVSKFVNGKKVVIGEAGYMQQNQHISTSTNVRGVKLKEVLWFCG